MYLQFAVNVHILAQVSGIVKTKGWSMSLYEIETKIAMIMADIEMNDGEIDEATEKLLDQLDQEETRKVDDLLAAIRNYEAQATAANNEAKFFKDVEKRASHAAESIEKYLLKTLGHDRKMNTRFGKLSFRQSEAVEIEGDIPAQFIRVEIKESPDKKMIKETIKEGGEVAGAKLVKNYSLSLK
jgi:hypothetical protein